MASKHPLQAYRERHDLSQEALADLIGVKAATISRWEQRKRTPRGADLDKISEVTAIPKAEILELSEAAQ
jgi:transcriptional regulator with XRE-family HTH domain